MQHGSRRTIRGLGVVVLGLTALLAVQLLCPVVSLAQAPESDTEQQSFRKQVIKSWKWEPGRGIGLTTEAYAEKYLARYFDSSGDWKGKSAGIGSYNDLVENPFVLFQSESVDIVVRPLSGVAHDAVVVVERQSGDVVLYVDFSCGDYKSRFEFVDVDGKAPLELLQSSDGSCASQFLSQSFRVYELSEWAELLEQRGIADFAGRCPKFMNQLIEPYPSRRKRDATGQLTLEFRLWYGLSMRQDEGYCAPSEPRTVIKRTCEYRDVKGRFECSDQVVDAHSFALSDLKTAYSWRDNADNIRWVLENADELRDKGFRFPEGFLERLPRHLPEGSQD